ncbi:WD40 repeat domain-containing protein [Aerosakkonema sp. BLCC-F183]|uniref:WD40 repeat domain-containing protein n=1 Tax=Aerosakkonema sp. BLCC-F183 TaxID=3342834 RepID=UPI0035BB6E2D
MTESITQPTGWDAVLGGQNAAPTNGVVLGGIEGVKKRFASVVIEQRIAALKEAIKYGKPGLEIVNKALYDESDLVQRSAYLMLRGRTTAEVRKALQRFNFYRFFECLRTLKGGTQVAISSDGETAAILKSNKSIKVWNLPTEELLYTVPNLPKGKQIYYIGLDKQTLVRSVQGTSNFVEVWQEGELQHTLYGHEDAIGAIAISPDGENMATGSQDKTIKIWDLQTGKLIYNISNSLVWGTHTATVFYLSYSPDGQTLISGGADGTVKLWNLRNRDKPRTFKIPLMGGLSIATSPNGEIIAAASWDKKIRLLHLETGEIIRILELHSGWANCLNFSPDGQTLVSSGADDKRIEFWDIKTAENLHTLTGKDKYVTRLAFSADGQTLYSAAQDKTIEVWGIK